ncbi:MAG: sigma-70 family RNA polymerase sigma factor [Planctomycetota bacterium]
MLNELSKHGFSSESTSSELLRQLNASKPEAWNRFAELYTPLVYRWARKTSLQPADAEDVTQEVFRVIARRIPDYQRSGPRGGSFRGWMWGITRNVILQHFERHRKRDVPLGGSTAHRQLGEVPDLLRSDTPPPDPDGDKALLMRVLRSIRNDFEESTWQAFWRTTVEGDSATDVGRDLAMTAAAVRQAKYRVLSRLREELPETT